MPKPNAKADPCCQLALSNAIPVPNMGTPDMTYNVKTNFTRMFWLILRGEWSKCLLLKLKPSAEVAPMLEIPVDDTEDNA